MMDVGSTTGCVGTETTAVGAAVVGVTWAGAAVGSIEAGVGKTGVTAEGGVGTGWPCCTAIMRPPTCGFTVPRLLT